MLIIFSIINLFRLLLLFAVCCFVYLFIKDKSIYFFLKNSGPSFIKLGQLLANRPDLIGDNLANDLSDFQDKLPSFSFKKAVRTIESEFGKPINQLFSEISSIPVASASIAQVHKAITIDGDVVAVKILRPNINKLIKRDIATLRILSFVVKFFSTHLRNKLLDIIELLESCRQKELDLFFEASAAEELKERLSDVKGFYIPKVYWKLVSNKVMVGEWIDGIPFSDHQAILESNFNKVEIAKNLVNSYFNQVYVHGFFHADMHKGNLFLMSNGDIAAVDFGITGSIDKKTRIAIVEILIAFLGRDYKRVAKLHIDAGLINSNIDVNEFILSCRVIGGLVVNKAVGQISMAKLLEHLLKMTKKYQMKTKPELLLLQKTMMLVEGIGIFLDKDINIWSLSKPFVKDWATKNIGFDAKIRDFIFEALELFKRFPDIISKINKSKNEF